MPLKRILTAAAALLLMALPALTLIATPASATEATFDRTLTVNGRAELAVATGSGTIHISRGASNQIHVFGKVRAGWGVSEDRVREIAAHPPIQQTGNIVRIGKGQQNLHNIAIDYEIQAPENAFLDAASGSGEIRVEGVGENAKLSSGSGSIRAIGMHGGFTLGTGSGSIYAEQSGQGDVKAETGSGDLDLKSINGSLRASTGSGSIKVSGTPVTAWKLATGSGSIELATGSAPLTLEASTGSGGIHSDRPLQTTGTSDRHHLTGKINGGGPTVRAETGSGSIRVY